MADGVDARGHPRRFSDTPPLGYLRRDSLLPGASCRTGRLAARRRWTVWAPARRAAGRRSGVLREDARAHGRGTRAAGRGRIEPGAM